ncbi:MAG: hypothetical protein IRZ26_05810 [Clostridia bacterium]|nr:hypothetical protein [Clostridia bacterium]MCL6522447.1 hypothetical protein [Bacillota bacterium]
MPVAEWLFWFLVPVVPLLLALNALVPLAGRLLSLWLERAPGRPAGAGPAGRGADGVQA